MRALLYRRPYSSVSLDSYGPRTGTIVSQPVGSVIHGWRVLESEYNQQFKAQITILKHHKYASRFCNIERRDSSNLFAIAFPTMPTDDSGVAHILEHTVLCGSKRFPVRDPFFKMLNRSLSSYMNAWTCPTFTMYPFCVPANNTTDMQNLRHVYFDAVFNPLLRRLDFLQEGWRLDYDNQDEASNLTIKGVVYNEMKGVFSDPENVFTRNLLRSTLPGFKESGGDPSSIPLLSHGGLVEFHKRAYHPSNSYFFAYGEHPLEEHLSFIDSQFNSEDLDRPVSPTKEVSIPFHFGSGNISVTGPCDPFGLEPAEQGRFIRSWFIHDLHRFFLDRIFPESDDKKAFKPNGILQDSFDFSCFSSLLIEGPSSPMFKSLIDTGLSRTGEYAPSSGYDSVSSRWATFSIGLSGINLANPHQVNEVENRIRMTLEEVSKEGFHPRRIESLLHSIELSLNHTTANFGLGLSHRILQSWITNEISPVEVMRVKERIERLRSTLRITDGKYFKDLCLQYLLNNEQSATFSMEADPLFEQKTKEKERQLLSSLVKNADLDQVLFDSSELKKDQITNANVSLLPTLSINDISIKSPTPTLWRINARVDGIRRSISCFSRIDCTNEIVYFKSIGFDLLRHASLDYRMNNDTSSDRIVQLPLVMEVISELGVIGRPIDDYIEDVKLHTAGISINLEVLVSPSGIV